MGFWVQLLIGVALMVISSYLNKPQESHPAAAEKTTAPGVQTGKSIYLLRGTRDIKSPGVVNRGRTRAVPIKKKGGKK